LGTLVVQMFLSMYIGCSTVYDLIFYNLLIHDRRVALLKSHYSVLYARISPNYGDMFRVIYLK